jgi:hypothetical protein
MRGGPSGSGEREAGSGKREAGIKDLRDYPILQSLRT